MPATTKSASEGGAGIISTGARIEEVSLELFRDRGYTATGIRDIASGSGVAISTLFHHFPNKIAILERLMFRAVDELLVNLYHSVDGITDPKERLSACVRALVVDHCLRTSLSFVAEKEVRHLTPETSLEIRRRRLQVRDMFVEAITRGVAEEEFECSDPKTAAMAAITMCTAVSSWYKQEGRLSPHKLAEQYVEYVLNLVRSH